MDGTDQIALALELTSWLGFGICLVAALLAVVAGFSARDWREGHGVVDDDSSAIRWFVDAGAHAGCATLSDEQRAWLDGRTEANVFYRDKRPGELRFVRPRSHARALWFTALGFLALGIAATVVQLFVVGS